MSKKYHKEIEEILKQATTLDSIRRQKPKESRILSYRTAWTYVIRFIQNRRWHITPLHIFTATSILLSVVIIWVFTPGWGGLVVWAIVLTIASASGIYFTKPPKIEKRWRGKLLYDNNTWWNWFRGKNH